VNSSEIKIKIKDLSSTMYKQMGTAASVNPYSKNYDNGDNALTIATGGNNSTSGGGGSETPSPAAPSPSIPATSKRDREKEREKARLEARQQIEKEREKEREAILNAALNMTSPRGRSRRSAAVVACANIAANIRDYNRSPDQLDIDERESTSNGRNR
jgi:hypothetical protein